MERPQLAARFNITKIVCGVKGIFCCFSAANALFYHMISFRTGLVALLALGTALAFEDVAAQSKKSPTGPKAVQSRKEELEKLRGEIEKTRQKLREQEQKESSILDVLARLDREIDTTHKLLRALQNEEALKQKEIDAIEQSLRQSEAQLRRLKEQAARRLVAFYKYGRTKDLEILLSARSLNQAYVWLQYEKRIAENDRRNYRQILTKQQLITQQRNLLRAELAAKRMIIDEKGQEERRLKEKRAERASILVSTRQDKKVYQKRLEEYQRAAEEIERLIAAAEKEREADIEKGKTEVATDFPTLKGKMPWPTSGKIVAPFGKNRHPQWKTITENLGIDIQAPLGSPVFAVARGKVTAITWQRGRGNILIVNHYGGYYTVYTHLQDIEVGLHEEVEAGHLLGTVGDSGSLSGPILHFEVWKNTQNLDPEEWLGRSGPSW